MSKRKPKWQREMEQKFRALRKQSRTMPWTDEDKDNWLKIARYRYYSRYMVRTAPSDLTAIQGVIRYVEEQFRSPYRKMPDYQIKHMISELKKMETEIAAKDTHHQQTVQEVAE